MEELIISIVDWFIALGDNYGVNPIIFGSIYVGAIPFFLISIAWLIRNYRRGKSIVLPSFLATLFFISAYLYLIVNGKNVPWWVYGIIVFLVIYGGWSTYRKIRNRINNINQENITDG